MLRELDKLDKRGEAAVRATLAGEGFALPEETVERVMQFSQVRSRGHGHAVQETVVPVITCR